MLGIGNVFEPRALDELFPDWRNEEDCPVKTKAGEDRFYWLTEKGQLPIPKAVMPPQLVVYLERDILLQQYNIMQLLMPVGMYISL